MRHTSYKASQAKYIDCVLPLNNSKFSDFVDHLFHIELEIKDFSDTARTASYLDPHRIINI